MMRTLNLPQNVAKRWLSPTASKLTFSSGETASSLEELGSVLDRVSDETVDFHLERSPNDISQWIMLEVGDYILAEIVDEASNRAQMLRFLEDHLAMLKDVGK